MESAERIRYEAYPPDGIASKQSPPSTKKELKEVWTFNLDTEMSLIMEAATRYPFIALDTEFPGICFRTQSQTGIFEYDVLRENVNSLKIIQLGITFCTADGKIAMDCPTWQFNFQFNLDMDMNNQESIQLLQDCGVDFPSHASKGIDSRRFAELFTMSGLVLNPSITWISFHGIYDFAYMLHLLIGKDLPEKRQGFDALLHIFFPHLYDIKRMIDSVTELNGGLNHIAGQLNIVRMGQMHQSGSDSRITAELFFKVKMNYKSICDGQQLDGVLYDASAARA